MLLSIKAPDEEDDVGDASREAKTIADAVCEHWRRGSERGSARVASGCCAGLSACNHLIHTQDRRRECQLWLQDASDSRSLSLPSSRQQHERERHEQVIKKRRLLGR